MSRETSIEYHTRRAADHRRMAEVAANSEIAAIHLILASQHEALVAPGATEGPVLQLLRTG